jgi:hypothetical protein
MFSIVSGEGCGCFLYTRHQNVVTVVRLCLWDAESVSSKQRPQQQFCWDFVGLTIGVVQLMGKLGGYVQL